MKASTLCALCCVVSGIAALGVACTEARAAAVKTPVAAFETVDIQAEVLAEVEAVLAPLERERADQQLLLSFDNSPVYELPLSTLPPLRLLASGTPVLALGGDEEWAEVRLPDGSSGWMLSTDLTPDKVELRTSASVLAG